MLRRLVITASVALAAVAAGCAVASKQPASRRPNLLVIVTDDQRWDSLGSTGDARLRTPCLDQLAQDGVRFDNAFVTTAICAASRASILTGQYEGTHGFTFGTPPLGDAHVAVSYPAQLKQAGYRTGFVGKFGVKTANGAPARMFDVFEPIGGPPAGVPGPDGTRRHRCDHTGDRALAFLDGCRADRPWCLSVSFHEPHAEDGDPRQYVWPSAFDQLYEDVGFVPPATMDPAFFAALPAFLRSSESRVRFGWRFDEPGKYVRMVRGYHRLIAAVDANVGRLRDALRDRGMAEDTVVVFTSDNGYFLGERGFADKWYAYEPSIRVPLLIVDPRAPQGHRGLRCAAMVLNVDLAPTLLDLAGVAVPGSQQGRSLRPLLAGDGPADWRRWFFYEHRLVNPRIPRSEGLRTERFTYLRWIDQQPVVEELYDHVADFEQTQSLVADPTHAATLAELRAQCDFGRSTYAGAAK
ncbi:MAG: sulfatase [Planctomycetes bacterium]|nr:sulfatase [Planctomycetota bacterium]